MKAIRYAVLWVMALAVFALMANAPVEPSPKPLCCAEIRWDTDYPALDPNNGRRIIGFGVFQINVGDEIDDIWMVVRPHGTCNETACPAFWNWIGTSQTNGWWQAETGVLQPGTYDCMGKMKSGQGGFENTINTGWSTIMTGP